MAKELKVSNLDEKRCAILHDRTVDGWDLAQLSSPDFLKFLGLDGLKVTQEILQQHTCIHRERERERERERGKIKKCVQKSGFLTRVTELKFPDTSNNPT